MVVIAIRERAADPEVGHQLAVGAEHELLRPRRGVLADLVHGRLLGRVERIETVIALIPESEQQLVDVCALVPVQVDGVVIDARILDRRDDARRPGAKLGDEGCIARAHKVLAILGDGIRDAESRGHRLEDLRVLQRTGGERREQGRQRPAGRNRRRAEGGRRAVPADAEIGRQAIPRPRVADVAAHVDRIALHGVVALHQRQDFRVAVVVADDPVPRVGVGRRHLGLAPAESELQFVMTAEGVAVQRESMLGTLRHVRIASSMLDT